MTLWYNADRERYGVLDEDDTWNTEGLHCGACFTALIGPDWLPVRLEYTQRGHEKTRGWYLIGPGEKALPAACQTLDGLRVKM